jgi:hypothetical protein
MDGAPPRPLPAHKIIPGTGFSVDAFRGPPPISRDAAAGGGAGGAGARLPLWATFLSHAHSGACEEGA